MKTWMYDLALSTNSCRNQKFCGFPKAADEKDLHVSFNHV